jgi:hypothetical protein
MLIYIIEAKCEYYRTEERKVIDLTRVNVAR